MSTKRMMDGTCIPLDRSSAPLAMGAILLFMLLAMGFGFASAAGRPAVDGVCFLVPLDRETTASVGGPMALADITVCYRALPEDSWSPATPVLKAQSATPAVEPTPVPADLAKDPVPDVRPDRS